MRSVYRDKAALPLLAVLTGLIVLYMLGFVVVYQTALFGEEATPISPSDFLERWNNALRAAFADNEDFFKPMPEPLPGDWLSSFEEKGQTFDQFIESEPVKPGPGRSVIYLQPIGNFSANADPSPASLKAFTEAFFQTPTKVLRPIDLDDNDIESRINPATQKRQFLCGDIENLLLRQKPSDAYAVIGVTLEDLSTKTDEGVWWNFVFGESVPADRVGVYSFARCDPTFFGAARPEDFHSLMVKRCCSTMAHELTHMFGVQHCISYQCLMNGSNSVEEADRQPLHLCPVDLRKLHSSVGFDVIKRYEALKLFYAGANITDEVKWLDGRIAYLKHSR